MAGAAERGGAGTTTERMTAMARMVGSASTRVEGLAALQRDLKRLGVDVDVRLKRVNLEASNEIVTGARSRAAGVSRMATRAASGLAPFRSARAGGVNLRSTPATPYAFGAEFGAARDTQRRRSTGSYVGYRQFDEWRGTGDGAGYFLWPTIRDVDVPTMYRDILDAVMRDLAS